MSGRYGVVVSFDEERGLGEVRGADGTTWPFHCTSIADGSRTIAVGARVRFEPLARFGQQDQANRLAHIRLTHRPGQPAIRTHAGRKR